MMGSDESHFNVSVGSDGQSHKTVSTNNNLFEEKGEPKRGPSTYQPNALPLGKTGSHRQSTCGWLCVYRYSVFTGGCTFGGVSVLCVYWKMYVWWSLCTLCLLEDASLVDLVYLAFTRGSHFGRGSVLCVYWRWVFGGVSVPCIYWRQYLRWG